MCMNTAGADLGGLRWVRLNPFIFSGSYLHCPENGISDVPDFQDFPGSNALGPLTLLCVWRSQIQPPPPPPLTNKILNPPQHIIVLMLPGIHANPGLIITDKFLILTWYLICHLMEFFPYWLLLLLILALKEIIYTRIRDSEMFY